MENKIYFLGNTKDFKLAENLFELLREDFTFDKKVAVFGKKIETADTFDVVAVELGAKVSDTLAGKVVTYSSGQSNADVCGFNFQKREKSRSLELLSGSFMGRVNIPVSSELTEVAVLYCGAGLVAAGISLYDALKAINSKIS